MAVYLKRDMVSLNEELIAKCVYVHGLPIDGNVHEAADLLEVTRACQCLNPRANRNMLVNTWESRDKKARSALHIQEEHCFHSIPSCHVEWLAPGHGG